MYFMCDLSTFIELFVLGYWLLFFFCESCRMRMYAEPVESSRICVTTTNRSSPAGGRHCSCRRGHGERGDSGRRRRRSARCPRAFGRCSVGLHDRHVRARPSFAVMPCCFLAGWHGRIFVGSSLFFAGTDLGQACYGGGPLIYGWNNTQEGGTGP